MAGANTNHLGNSNAESDSLLLRYQRLLDRITELERQINSLLDMISRDIQQLSQQPRLHYDDGNGFGGVPASAAAIAKLKRNQHNPMMGPRRTKRCVGKDEFGSTTLEACPVCFEDFVVGDGLMVMPCKHKFHEVCLAKWLALSHLCPCCRHALPSKEDEAAEQVREAVRPATVVRDDANEGSEDRATAASILQENQLSSGSGHVRGT